MSTKKSSEEKETQPFMVFRFGERGGYYYGDGAKEKLRGKPMPWQTFPDMPNRRASWAAPDPVPQPEKTPFRPKPRCLRVDGHSCPYAGIDHPPPKEETNRV